MKKLFQKQQNFRPKNSTKSDKGKKIKMKLEQKQLRKVEKIIIMTKCGQPQK